MSNSIKVQIRLPELTSWNFPSASATACSWERPSVWRSLLYRSEDLQIASVVPSWTASPCWSSHFCTKKSDCCSCSPSQLPFASVVWIAGPILAFCCSQWKIFRCFWIIKKITWVYCEYSPYLCSSWCWLSLIYRRIDAGRWNFWRRARYLGGPFGWAPD